MNVRVNRRQCQAETKARIRVAFYLVVANRLRILPTVLRFYGSTVQRGVVFGHNKKQVLALRPRIAGRNTSFSFCACLALPLVNTLVDVPIRTNCSVDIHLVARVVCNCNLLCLCLRPTRDMPSKGLVPFVPQARRNSTFGQDLGEAQVDVKLRPAHPVTRCNTCLVYLEHRQVEARNTRLLTAFYFYVNSRKGLTIKNV